MDRSDELKSKVNKEVYLDLTDNTRSEDSIVNQALTIAEDIYEIYAETWRLAVRDATTEGGLDYAALYDSLVEIFGSPL